ncbi:methylenetetrahydrofolate dehydrogenase (NADP+) / methenyltetrahydrofolate cyclohydrolase [Deinococcus reticulitermitis]|uniref:Bifunctional protein FolD n=1 Tax=Deinococcus reticulitermitis TaxID=856736 RepID=A0A1H6WD09_9DEIO|nr:tetrahydrofolate dehydrogenase/cyclohydrolase catalytic domain-containing protein [Deinococcus reticulitermitis]SEJ14763.1 methylenetetrahydrofolate dehydrogenase (NADP+) / methenyltetrahydrofolate cyclohydrolase [Deinococcus reticulitermitis]
MTAPHTAQILTGPPAAEALLKETAERAARLARTPHLSIVRLGEDPASVSYVAGKDAKAKATGLSSAVHALPAETTQADLLALIGQLNADPQVNGILVQLPLPRHIDEEEVLLALDPDKDVDGFHPVNVGRLWTGHPASVPCTPQGVMYLLRHYGVEVSGKRAVVVGRSNIVGRPMAGLLLGAHATVTVAHSRTRDLGAVTREAELLVVAVGQAHFITPDLVRPGAVVIDVGINRVERAGKKPRLLGDVHPDVAGVASALTPVPGGVGPLTIAQLLANTVAAAERQAVGQPAGRTSGRP